MIFLNPTILLGLLAASIPIILHFLNLRKIKRIEFSTLAFLKELQKSKIKKKDADYLIDILRYLIDKQYIYTSKNVDNTQITQKLVFNTIIQILDA